MIFYSEIFSAHAPKPELAQLLGVIQTHNQLHAADLAVLEPLQTNVHTIEPSGNDLKQRGLESFRTESARRSHATAV